MPMIRQARIAEYNGITEMQNMIQENVGGRKDYKIDCIAAEFKDWEVSW